MSWDSAAAAMDAEVDARLGDTISYAANGVTFVDVSGFVLFTDVPLGLDASDEIFDARPRVKLAKAVVPYPDPQHRLRSTKLGEATYRPAGSLPQEQGRYWLFDVERI